MIFILEKSLDRESTIKHKAPWREPEMKKIAGKKEKIKHLLPIESVFNALLRKLELKFEGPKSAKWSAQKGVKAVGEGECGELPIQWNRRDWNAIIFGDVLCILNCPLQKKSSNPHR